MKNSLVPAAAVVLTCALIDHAQAMLAGKWQGETPNGSLIVLDLSGELTGDQLKVWLDRQGASSAVLLERIKG